MEEGSRPGSSDRRSLGSRAVTAKRVQIGARASIGSSQLSDGRPARIEDFTSETVVRFVKAVMQANEAGRQRSLTPPPHCIYMETACVFADVSGKWSYYLMSEPSIRSYLVPPSKLIATRMH